MARVLVIEDDQQTAAEITAALGDHGFDVDVAHTGREGLLNAAGDKYDAIVLDRMLPGGIDGLDHALSAGVAVAFSAAPSARSRRATLTVSACSRHCARSGSRRRS